MVDLIILFSQMHWKKVLKDLSQYDLVALVVRSGSASMKGETMEHACALTK